MKFSIPSLLLTSLEGLGHLFTCLDTLPSRCGDDFCWLRKKGRKTGKKKRNGEPGGEVKNVWSQVSVYISCPLGDTTVGGRNPANQLIGSLSSMIYRVSQVVSRISSINSIMIL